jgi:hypothetical protein
MTSQERTDQLADAGRAEAPEFRIAIVFDNENGAERANQVCHRLMARFEASFVYRITTESLAALEEPSHFNGYLEFSRSADMIFIVSDGPLPAVSKQWLKDCIQQHTDAPFVLADMTQEGLSNALGNGSLQSPAGRCRVDVIQERHGLRPGSEAERDVRRCRVPRWGINE